MTRVTGELCIQYKTTVQYISLKHFDGMQNGTQYIIYCKNSVHLLFENKKRKETEDMSPLDGRQAHYIKTKECACASVAAALLKRIDSLIDSLLWREALIDG